MTAVFRNRNFSLLWAAGLVSLMGNWMLFVALPFHVYDLTGSALATSGLLMAMILPGLLFSSVAGVFVDRWDRRRTMILVSLLQALVIPALLLVQSADMVWLVYVVAFVEASLGRFFSPAESALLPNLVDEELLVPANSLNALNDNLARIIGPAIGGVLLGVTGFASVIIFDAVSYVVAALLILLIAAPALKQGFGPLDRLSQRGAAESTAKLREKFVDVWRELVEGLRLVARSRVLTATFIVAGVALLGDAILSAILVVFVKDDMGLTAVEFGWMMTARGLGGLIGALIIAQFGRKLSTSTLVTGGLIFSGVVILLMVSFPDLYVALALLVLGGPLFMAWIVSLHTIFQQGTEDEYRGRIFGTFGTISALLMVFGAALGGGAADLLGGTVLITAAAVVTIIAGLISWALLSRPVKQMELATAGD